MRARMLKKAVAMILSAVLVVSLLPVGTLAADSRVEYIDYNSPEDLGKFDLLGFGFNALSNQSLSQSTIIYDRPINLASSDLEALKVMGGGSYTEAKYANSAQEMMHAYGIEYSNSASLTAPIKRAKVGFENKFSLAVNLSNRKTYQSLYYQYTNTTVRGKYAINLYDNQKGSIDILDSDFINALNALNNQETTDAQIAAFFEKWGTHVLTNYEIGYYLEFVETAHSLSSEVKFDTTVTNSMSASVGKGKLSASVAQSVMGKLQTEENSTEIVSSASWRSFDKGNPMGVAYDYSDPAKIETVINNWVAGVTADNEAGGQNAVLLPESTNWIAIWELIPNEYSALKNRIQAYYKAQAETSNKAFFAKFTSYGNVTGENMVYYQSVTGKYFPVDYQPNMYVAPNSEFNAVDRIASLDNVQITVSGPATKVDEYGTIAVNADAKTDELITVRFCDLNGEERGTKVFKVKPEGKAGLYAGGYGDKERPYQISTPEQFSNIKENSSDHFVLINDISLTNVAPIASFSGVLDGNGYTLSDWEYKQALSDSIGLFRENTGTIKNLGIENFKVENDNPSSTRVLYVGLLCGWNKAVYDGNDIKIGEGILENIQISGGFIKASVGSTSVDAHNYLSTGILVGHNQGIVRGVVSQGNQSIAYVYTQGWSANVYSGNIVGSDVGGTIEDVTAYGNTLEARAGANSGGGSGWGHWHGNPYAYAGGIVGDTNIKSTVNRALGYDNNLQVSAARTCGDSQPEYCGAVVGYQRESSISNCYTQVGDLTNAWLIGNDQNTAKENVAMPENLKAAGILSSLTGFRTNGWYQDPAGGHPYPAQPVRLEISTNQAKTEYFVGEPLNLHDLVIKAVTDNETYNLELSEKEENPQRVYKGYQVSGYDPNKIGKQTITITYGKISGTFDVTVASPAIESIMISNLPHKTSYFKPHPQSGFAGEMLDFDGLSVIAKYTDGKTAAVPFEELVLPEIAVVTASRDITVGYKGLSASYTIEAFDVQPTQIEMVENSYKKNYALGENFDPTGVQVKLTYNNGNTAVFRDGDIQIDATAYQKDVADTYRIIVKCEGMQTFFDVIVGAVRSISISSLPSKLFYYSSEKELETEGLTLLVTYDNGTTKEVSAGYEVSGYDSADIGKQEITVTYGGVTATFQVTVVAVEMTSVEIVAYPKTNYYSGDTFTASGLILKAHYNDSGSKEIYDGFTVQVDGFDVDEYPALVTLGSKNVQVTYVENGVRKTVQYQIHVVKNNITELQLVQDPNQTTYNLWDNFNYSGMKIYAVYTSGETVPVELNESMFSVRQFTASGTQTVVMTYEGRTIEMICTVNAPSAISVSKLPAKTEYAPGEQVLTDGIEVTAHFSNNVTKVMDPELLDFSCPATDTLGSKIVKVRFGTLETEFEIVVKDGKPSTITSTVYDVNNGVISAINAGTTVETLLSGIEEGEFCTIYADGEPLAMDKLVGTGMIIKIMDGEETKIELVIVVAGDVNGDGKISVTDMLAVKAHLLDKEKLDGAHAQAADVTDDNKLSITDFIQVKAHLLGKEQISVAKAAPVMAQAIQEPAQSAEYVIVSVPVVEITTKEIAAPVSKEEIL